MRISIIGLGYVGLSNALLLCQKYDVVGVDIDYEKVIAINIGFDTAIRETKAFFGSMSIR